jgi:hypothetical protein
MERRALVVALALTLPLALYGVPYAYATITSSSYVNNNSSTTNDTTGGVRANCNSGDYATGGGYMVNDASVGVLTSEPTVGGHFPNPGQTPDSHTMSYFNGKGVTFTAYAFVICQTPITVAGIGVPQFGSLYFAIALGAVAYFMLSRRFGRRPTLSAQAN